MILADTVTCGNGAMTGVPSAIPYFIHLLYFSIQVLVPILLILYGMWDLGQAVIKQKDEDIKKARSTFVQRLIAAVLVFLVATIALFVIGLVADATDSDNDNVTDVTDCVQCMLEDNCIVEKN
jgi:quinol-cytochrome oxidoreductase complex cytochrome b subunit